MQQDSKLLKQVELVEVKIPFPFSLFQPNTTLLPQAPRFLGRSCRQHGLEHGIDREGKEIDHNECSLIFVVKGEGDFCSFSNFSFGRVIFTHA